MGALKLQYQRAGTVRRVVRVSGEFVCGVCRNSYEDLHSARGCLERCWQRFLNMNPVIVKKVNGQLTHRCRFCARDYDGAESARQCAEQCKMKLQRKVAAEARVADSADHMPVRKPRPASGLKRAMTRVVVPVAPVRRKPSLKVVPSTPEVEKIVEEAVLTITADANESAVGPVVDPVELTEAGAGKTPEGAGKKKKPSEVFYRDQANYVCTVCNQKYFTKVEVTNCYESHE